MNRRNEARVGIWPVIALTILATIPAVALGYLWKWAESKETKPVVEAEIIAPIPAALTTPILSFRRAPQTLASVTGEATLVSALSNVALFIPDQSCLVVSLNGRIILDRGGDVKVTPASNEKLLTAMVALDQLGDAYTYTTRLMGTVVDGVVQGPLYFVGGGDPTLATADYPASIPKYAPTNTTSLEALVATLQAAGVTQISGGIVGDESRYDQERFIPTWADDVKNVEAGPLSALLVNDATSVIGTTQREPDPARGAAQLLRTLLRNVGITVNGNTSNGVTPPDATEIASIQSAPLSTIVGDMLTNSDDNTAEMLVKELGYHFNGSGTTATGLEVIKSTLLTKQIDTTQISQADGSGLDNSDVVTCNILLQVLVKSLNGPIGTGLAIAGHTGTLFDKFLDTGLNGRLKGKTGSLNNVRALTGYVPTALGTIEFSMVLNFPDADQDPAYTPIWNAFANAVAPYPSGPSVEVLQPR